MKNKRIGIVTLYYKNFNYGGLLQAYALQNTIESLGFEAEQISIDRRGLEKLETQISIKKFVRYQIIRRLNNTLKDIRAGFFSQKRKKSNAYFEEFMMSIPHSKVYNKDTIQQVNSEYDCFVCGSDQIWNPIYSCDMYFLNFVSNDKKKISYAASIGLETLKEEEAIKITKNIENFDAISVREEIGRDILKSYLKRKIEVVLDPTFLLDSKDWDRITEDNKFDFEYMFVYCLGFTNSFAQLIRNFAREKGLKIINIPTRPEHISIGDINLYEVGPKEFISLIKHSSFVLTDSFHASVFSIIYRKQFRTFSREISGKNHTMNSRIQTLMDILEDNVLINEATPVSELNRELSFDKAKSNILVRKELSLNYLKNALNEVDCE